ncbi:hypothetical protein BJX76DRAFT_339293 [Aspergillus varians]
MVDNDTNRVQRCIEVGQAVWMRGRSGIGAREVARLLFETVEQVYEQPGKNGERAEMIF